MQHLILVILKDKYLIIFPLAAFEGPIVGLAVGFMASLGYLSVPGAYAVILLGDFVPDTIFYYIGSHGHKRDLVRKYGKKIGLTEVRFDVIKKIWHNHGFKTMFVSKFAFGLTPAFLIGAGATGMPYKKYFSYCVPITLFTQAVLLGLGYYLGNSYELILKYLKGFELIIAVVAVLIIVAYQLFTRFMKKELEIIEEEEMKK